MKTINVVVELHSGERCEYNDATRVAEENKYKTIIYKNADILAILDSGEIKKLLTRDN